MQSVNEASAILLQVIPSNLSLKADLFQDTLAPDTHLWFYLEIA